MALRQILLPWDTQPLEPVDLDSQQTAVVEALNAGPGRLTSSVYGAGLVNTGLTYRPRVFSGCGPCLAAVYGGAGYSELPAAAGAFGAGGFSVSFHIHVNAVGTVVGNNRSGTASGWLISINGSGQVTINTAASFATSLTSTTNIADGLPHFVSVTRSSAGIYRIYIDGAQDATSTTTAYNVNSGFNPLIGAQRTTGSPTAFSQIELPFLALHRADIGADGHRALLRRPWDVFEPQRIFVPVASGAPGAITGASSGTVSLSGSSAGTVAIAGASAGTLALTATSAGAVAVSGASSASVTLTGSAAGAALVAGASAGSVALTGSAAGAAIVSGASSGTVTLTGSASGTTTGAVSGTSSATIDLAAAAAGQVRIQATSAAVLALAGSASGTVTGSGVTGQSSVTFSLAGTAAGAVLVRSASDITISIAGTATGHADGAAEVLADRSARSRTMTEDYSRPAQAATARRVNSVGGSRPRQ